MKKAPVDVSRTRLHKLCQIATQMQLALDDLRAILAAEN